MIRQQLVWTALPWDFTEDGRPRLSALLSPRLQTNEAARPTLEAFFPDFVDWPAIVNEAEFVAELDDGTQLVAERISDPAESGLWAELFRPETFVRPFEFKDLSSRVIRSYTVRSILGYVREVYREVGRAAPEELPKLRDRRGGPSLDDLLDTLGPVLDRLGKRGKLTGKRDPLFRERMAIDPDDEDLPTGSARIAFDFTQAQRFYDRPEFQDDYRPEPDLAAIPPPPEVPEVDFHKMVASLGDYPHLLRRLGLVVDLALDFPGKPDTGDIRVVPSWGEPSPSGSSSDFCPWTRYQGSYDPPRRRFLPRPRKGSDLDRGLLVLDYASDDLNPDSRFDLVQVDPDGAALRLISTADSLSELHSMMVSERASFDTPEDAGLPTLRSTGIAVVRRGRAARLAKHVQDARDRFGETDDSAVFHNAEQLLRGYRVDIRDLSVPGVPWRPLCARDGDYRLGSLTLRHADEGYVKGTTAASADGDQSDLYLHESLVTWDGWSLAVERPGQRVYPKPYVKDGRAMQDEEIDRRPPELATQFDMEAEFNSPKGTLPRLRYGHRYLVRARAVDLAGNSIEFEEDDDTHASREIEYLRYEPVPLPVLVPRRAYKEGESLERMVIRSNYDQTAAVYSAQPADERHVLPPKTSQLMAETHGMLDDGIGAGRPHDPAYAISVRELGTLGDVAGRKVVKAPQTPADWPPDRDPPGSYVICPNEPLTVPWLPDVFARGVVLRGLPGIDEPFQLRFDGDWPDNLPFRLQIVERPGATAGCVEQFENPEDPPRWDEPGRVLTAYLAKGEVRTVRYACWLHQADVRQMGIWHWIAGTQDEDELMELAREGRHWMLTPFRELVLVHAVQQPLCEPEIKGIASARDAGQTFADLRGRALFSVRTTGQLDLDARWTEPIDDLQHAGPEDRDGRSHVGTMRVDPDLPEDVNPLPPLEGDKYRELRHEFGDTKHRLVEYRLTATTRFREYFPPALAKQEGALTRTGEWVAEHVRSSARPDAPKVLYAVPSFRWEGELPEPGAWTSLTRARLGGGLRVYLERPWYSSGADELLGVTLWRQPGPVPESHRHLVSQYGKDPIWDSATPLDTALRAGDFSSVAGSESGGIQLDERPGGPTLAVAGFKPEYHAERRLWFADIVLRGKAQASYYPFIRLALCRYQPWSIGLALAVSRVVPLDFAQLAPDRTLSVSFVPGSDQAFDVALSGPGPDGPFKNRVEVTIEYHDDEIPGELGWKPWQGSGPYDLAEGVPDPGPWLSALELSDALIHRFGVRERAAFRAGSPEVARVRRASVPTIRAERAAEVHDFGSLEISELPRRLPLWVLPGHRLWSGRLRLPEPRGAHRFRLVIREYERYVADAEVGEGRVREKRPVYYKDRVVYAETVEV